MSTFKKKLSVCAGNTKTNTVPLRELARSRRPLIV